MIFIWRTLSATYFLMFHIPFVFIVQLSTGIMYQIARLTFHYFNEELKNRDKDRREFINELFLKHPICSKLEDKTWFLIYDIYDIVSRPFEPLATAITETKKVIKAIKI